MIIFQFVGVTSKQGVGVVTQRSFHPKKQTLDISQGTVRESESTSRILCLHKTRYDPFVFSILGIFFSYNLFSLLLLFHFSVFEIFCNNLKVESKGR